ncbi:molybdopterin molybdotransferase MoeA [Nocardioides zeae]|uniref:Molybdopterin molybdenumtransferase n=1 Tax=Nocardioides imazamoxiresistens TaxID=3231893 RepID=A0ABU3PWK2_9ACTN|nr:gephyrin-like molybdotransferase Glp [Nocardioides zeae]MDT9593584.1 molybdopterin molybdotransferase MoeA [Nocardioides zeae]
MADQDMIGVPEFFERVMESVEPLAPMSHSLQEASGLACAENVAAELSLPSFDNASMDGYAVVSADVAGSTPASPTVLPVVGEIGAGTARIMALSPGTAVKIMTGAPVPAGCDAVVPYEWTDAGVAQVRIDKAPKPLQHIRRAGEDVGRGDVVVGANTVLGPRQIGLLAAVGRSHVYSRPKPRVVVLSTGSELRDPGSQVGHDSIYDGNSYMLAAAARAAGAIAYRVGIVPDDPGTFLETVHDQLVRADLVVTSGGVSAGDYDVVKAALSGEPDMWFGRVAMQPGKPQGVGTIGEDRTPIITLPGNPVSAYVSFEVFVLPAIRKLMGLTPYARPLRRALLTHPVSSIEGKRQFLRGDYSVPTGVGGNAARAAHVTPVGGPGSHMLGDLAASNALIVVPESVTRVEAGQPVHVLALDEQF